MGWAEGLNAGINLGNVIRQGMMQQDLAEEAKKYKVTEGAYGSGLNENLQQVIGARDQALQGLGEGATPEQIQQVHEQYTPAMAELSRRVGLSGPDYSVASGGYDGGKNFDTMKEAQTAAAPLRTQGLSDVYRSYGQIDKAEELTARAQQQQLTGLQLNKAMREDEDAVRMQAFEKDYSALENPSDMTAVKSLAAKHQLNRGQQFTVASQISGIDKAELEVLDTYVKKAVKGKDLDGLLTLHKDDKNFADGTHFVKAVGANGQVILNLVSDAEPTKVLRTESFQSADLATAYLRKQAEDPGNVAEWALGVRAKQATIAASEGEASLVPYKKGLYAAQAAAWGSKPETAATAAENKQFTELTKTTAWQAAERKGDTAAMNSLMIGRGLNPSKHGGGEGAPGWGGGNKPTAKPEGVKTTPAAEVKPSKPTETKPTETKPTETKPTEKELNARVDYNSYQEKARAAREKGLQDRAARQEQEALAAQQADELAARRRAQIAADFRSKYGG